MNAPVRYEITVSGRLSETLTAAFEGFTASSSSGETVLSGQIVDQSALYGVLERIESLGLELLDVRRTGARPIDSNGGSPCHPC